ncbi:hypothetical protein [Streptomyces sp. NPDC059979]|uniref:hypothetical protein n=1 Tax=Streptomyces sp. NPDC059979 TaxID=3347021 RepID=UPI0036A23A89
MENSQNIARSTAIETRTHTPASPHSPAAAAALRLLGDAINRGADYQSVVDALNAAQLPEAFASVLDAASEGHGPARPA